MAEKGFRLKLSGDGINVDRAVSAEVAQQIVAIALGTAPSVGKELGKQVAASVAQGLAAQASAGCGSPSVREFLLQQEAKRIPEQITTIALFLKNHRNSAVFTKKDLVKAFEDAQEPVSSEFRDDRFSAAFDRKQSDPSVFTVAYVVRAVSPGRAIEPRHAVLTTGGGSTPAHL